MKIVLLMVFISISFISGGNEVAVLVNELKPEGSNEISFDESGLASGLYTYVLSSGNFIQSKKMMHIK